MIKELFYAAAVASVVTVCSRSVAQEVRFSQYQAAPLLLNPASPGAAQAPTLSLNYRLQQLGVISYKTGYFSTMLPLYPANATYEDLPIGGLGLGVMSDLAGEQNELRTFQFDLSGAYNLRLNTAQTHYVTLGLQASLLQTNLDYSALIWPSQVTFRGPDGPPPSTAQFEDQTSVLRFNTGFIWVFDPTRNITQKVSRTRWHLGASVGNLNRPDYSFLNDDSQVLAEVYRVHGGVDIRASPRISVQPGFFIISQNTRTQYTGGGTVSIHLRPEALSGSENDFRLRVGGWYRYDDAAVLLIGGSSPRTTAALSYDLNASSERTGIGRQNTVELSIAYRFLRTRTPEYRPNPLF